MQNPKKLFGNVPHVSFFVDVFDNGQKPIVLQLTKRQARRF
jgi:hypothetical protein